MTARFKFSTERNELLLCNNIGKIQGRELVCSPPESGNPTETVILLIEPVSIMPFPPFDVLILLRRDPSTNSE